MDILINNIKSMPNLRMTRSAVEKKTSKERSKFTSKKEEPENDQVILSKYNKSQQEAIEENQQSLEKKQEENELSQEKIQEFHEKIKENQYNLEEVDNKIVYSLMTLPAFNRFRMSSTQPDAANELQEKTIKNEIDELKNIQEELSHGEKMDKVLEDALDYLMRSLIS